MLEPVNASPFNLNLKDQNNLSPKASGETNYLETYLKTIPPVTDKLAISNKTKKGSEPGNIFADIPAARNLQESKEYLEQRREAIISEYVDNEIPEWVGKVENGTAGKVAFESNVKFISGTDIEKTNQILKKAYSYSNVGTHTKPVRSGDYDFTLTTMTATVYNNLDNPALHEDTKKHIIKNVLNQEGNNHLNKRWLLGIIPETENHILMTESSRYLKNQLVEKYGMSYSTDNMKSKKYDNDLNGFNNWFVDHLSQFARNDFDEYNARPYQAYTVRAIQNMYDFADDPKVQKSAHIVMDYISARFATQSSELRRVVPFRRRQNYKDNDNLFEKDSQSARFAVLAGNYNGFDNNTDNKFAFPKGHILSPAMSKYKVPDAILDLMVDKGNNPHFMTAHHENTEIVYSEENFTVSAGGHYHDWSKLPFSSQEDGISMPTVIMLKGQGPSLSNMIRFLGRADDGKVNNTGVYENFASGIRPVFPEKLEKELKESGKLVEKGNWKFAEIDNVYVAFYSHSQKSPDNYAPSVGFSEVVDKKEFSSLNDFINKVEKNNQGKSFNHYGNNLYTTSRGKTIEFVMAEKLENKFFGGKKAPDNKPELWNIRNVWDNGKKLQIETHLEKWKLADSYTMNKENDGENNDYVIKADGTGQIIINNPNNNQSLLMSLADHDKPIRIEQNGEAINLSETDKTTLSRTSIKNGFDYTVKLDSPEKVRYLSLKWDKKSEPQHVHVYILKKGESDWTLAEKRKDPFSSDDYDFRTDFDLSDSPEVLAVKFLVTGKKLNLEGKPEVYQAFPENK